MSGILDLSNLWGAGGGNYPQIDPSIDPNADVTGSIAPAAPVAAPSGATVLATLRPALARAQSAVDNPTQHPYGFGDSLMAGAGALKDVRGMDKGSAFATGLSGGIQAAQQGAMQNRLLNQQQQQNNISQLSALWQIQNGQDQNTRAQAELALRQGQDARAAKAQQLEQQSAAMVPDPDNPGQLKVNPVAVDAAKQLAEARAADPYGDKAAAFDKYYPGGTPAQKADFVLGTNVSGANNKPMNQLEEKMYGQADDKVKFLTGSISDLQRAKDIIASGKVYGGWLGQAKMLGNDVSFGGLENMGVLDPETVKNTAEVARILGTASMSQGKDLFGQRVTNYEERLLQDLKASMQQSPTKASGILDTMIKERSRSLADNAARATAIKNGTFSARGSYLPPAYDPYQTDIEKQAAQAGQGATPASAPAPAAPQQGGAQAAPAPAPAATPRPVTATGPNGEKMIYDPVKGWVPHG